MKFRQGDRIRHIDTGWEGAVIGVDSYGSCNILVSYDENEEIKGDNEYYVRAEDIEFIDKRQAFMERLRELLRDFDAEIEVCLDATASETIVISLGDNFLLMGQKITAQKPCTAKK